MENFTTSLGVNGLCVSVEYYGTYGVTYLDGYMAKADSLRFGPMVVGELYTHTDNLLYFGWHPWRDILSVDWNTLPLSLIHI